jgi:hypothetical protein
VFCVGGGAPAASPEAAACREANLAGLHDLLAHVSGSYKDLPRAVDMCALFPMGSVASTGFLFSLQLGAECTIEVRRAVCCGAGAALVTRGAAGGCQGRSSTPTSCWLP